MINTIQDLDKKYIWHPFTPLQGMPEPIALKSAQGVELHTEDGRVIIDAVSSWWVNIHGHSNAIIANAIADQAMSMEHVIFAGFTHKPAVDLAQNLVRILPAGLEKIFFSDNGSTSVEVALKMAIQFWYNQGIAKRKIIAFEGAYHGDTFGSMSVGDRSVFSAPFDDYLFEVAFLPFPTSENAEEVTSKMQSYLQDQTVAAFIYEPLVQGAGGMRFYESGILNQLMQMAHSKGALCIADEVMTGFGRTGKLFASQYLDQSPDIICISKGITGGFMPLGVTACTQQIVAAFDTPDKLKAFYHGHSYTGNPLACAAANASFGILTGTQCQDQIQMISQKQAQFVERIKNHRTLLRAESLGTIMAIELKTQGASSYFNEIRNTIYQHFIGKGLLLRPLGNTIYVMPPYVITEQQLDRIYQEIELFIEQL